MKAFYYENNSENGVLLVSGDRFVAIGGEFNDITVNRDNIPRIVNDIVQSCFDDEDFEYVYCTVKAHNDQNLTSNAFAGAGNPDAVIDEQDYAKCIYRSPDVPDVADLDSTDEDEQDEDEDEDPLERLRHEYNYLLAQMEERAGRLTDRVIDLEECGRRWEKKAHRYDADGNTRRMKECDRKADEFYTMARIFKDAARVLGFYWAGDHFIFDI